MRIRSACFRASAFSKADFPKDGRPEIALVGRSNVGKSCMINQLLRRADLARTSSTPGRTRSINFFLVNDEFYLVDFPGYGYARVPQAQRKSWKSLAEDYLADRPALALCLLVIDIRRGWSPLDLQLSQWLESVKIPLAGVLTKSDKLSANPRRVACDRIRKEHPHLPLIAFSARSELGRDQVWLEMNNALSRSSISIA